MVDGAKAGVSCSDSYLCDVEGHHMCRIPLPADPSQAKALPVRLKTSNLGCQCVLNYYY